MRVEEELILEELRGKGLNPVIVSSSRLLRIPEPDLKESLILVRNISAYNSIYVAAIVEASGGMTINNLKSLIIGHDKILSYSTLLKAGLKIPKTAIALDGVDLEDLISKIDYPHIDKPPIGSWGRLVSLIENPRVLEQVYNYRKLMGTPQLRIHLIQKPAKLGQDLRCLVVGEEVVACMERIGPQGDWRSNAALGGHVKAYKPPQEVEELSIKASLTIEAEIAGVDIVYDEENYYVNEVNVVPEFKALIKATNINIAERIVDYVVKKMKS